MLGRVYIVFLSDTYANTYDKAGRLLGSTRYSGESGTPLSTLTESGISYDDSGNLTVIKRYGESSGTVPVDDLAFSYTGTRRTGYAYDAHGNVTQDSTNGTILEWNILGLPKTIADSTDTARRVYAADGTLLAVYGGTAGTVGDLYLGSSIYERKASGTVSLESAGWEGGRILSGAGTANLIYQITDHLGSVRAVRRGNGTVERRFDYYPFGSESRHWAWSGQLPFPKTQAGGDAIPKGGGFDFDFEPIILGARAATSRWRLGGKEIAGQKVGASAPAGTPAAAAGRPYLDFGARLYDPRTAAWLSQDPLSEKYYGISPYAYCAGNPVNLVDMKGKKIVFVNGLLALGSTQGGAIYWNGEQSPFVTKAKTILADNNLVFLDVKHKWYSSAKRRYKTGYQFAKDNIDYLTSNLEEGESFKFVTHSMGAAYAEGMAKYLLEEGYSVEMLFHFSPYQAAKYEVLEVIQIFSQSTFRQSEIQFCFWMEWVRYGVQIIG